MRKNKRSVLYALCMAICGIYSYTSQAQYNIKFDRLGTDQGLTHGNITAIFQDQYGFIWIGTEDGLNRYDGYDITIFRNNSDDTTSIDDNRILSIAEDADGNIWVGTNSNVNRFDRNSNSFKRYLNDPQENTSLSGQNVVELLLDSKKNFWLATGGGLSKYDSETDAFQNYFHVPNDRNSLSGNGLTGVTEDQKGNIWVSNDKGVSMLNLVADKWKNYSYSDGQISSDDVRKIFCDSKNRLWVGHFETGVTMIDLNSNHTTFFRNEKFYQPIQ